MAVGGRATRAAGRLAGLKTYTIWFRVWFVGQVRGKVCLSIVNPPVGPIFEPRPVDSAHASMANHGAELYSAAYHGNAASIRKLISRGADLKWRHPQGGATALYVACEFGHAEAAQLLLESGAPADAARDDGATPLYKACQDGGRTDIVLMLLSAGAQVDQMDNAGMTPLWVACHQGKPVLVRALLDAKADPMRKVQGWGPLDLAKSEGREEIVQLLVEYLPPEAAAAVAAAAVERRAPTQTEELYVACFHGQEATVRQVGRPLPPPSSPAPSL